MAQSVDITLPKSHKPRFPDRCVVCGAASPGSHVRIITGSIGWWTWILWCFGKPFVVKAPSCKGCGWKLHGTRLASLSVTIAIAALALYFLWPYVEASVPRGLAKGVMMAIMVACLLPQLLFQVYFAPPFDVTAYSNKVEYEFTSIVYATEFALLNGRFSATDEPSPDQA